MAWRAWTLITQDGEPVLRSIVVDAIWTGPQYTGRKPEIEKLVALDESAMVGGSFFMPSLAGLIRRQHEKSLRGIYAVKAPRFLPSEYARLSPVIGLVALSGRVIEHERGYRAERAMIRHLYVNASLVSETLGEDSTWSPLDLCAILSERYHCEVEMADWCPMPEIVR